MLDKKLQLVDEELFSLGKKLNLLQLITPINWEIEKEKFFQNKNYSPQFDYAIDLEFLNQVEKELLSLEIKTKFWQGILLEEVREKFLDDLDLIRTIGHDRDEFQKFNFKKYVASEDLVDLEILNLAEKEIKDYLTVEEKEAFGALYIKEVFEDFLGKNKIEWKLKINESLVPLLSVNYFERTILMNPLIVLTKREIQKMLVHEVETHIYRFLNGTNLFKMAGVGLKNYEKTAEGLAAYNESLIFPEDKACFKRFYDRYKTVIFGLQNSFSKLYEYLREELSFDAEESWRMALRVKRGLVDSSQKGAFLKDRIYLQGFFAVRNLNSVEIENLYKGKFAIEHLYSKQFNLDDDELVQKAQYLPLIYKNKNV